MTATPSRLNRCGQGLVAQAPPGGLGDSQRGQSAARCPPRPGSGIAPGGHGVVPGQLRKKLLNPGLDAVPDQPHAFHAFDAAFGGLVRFPGFKAGAFVWFDFRFGAQDDDDVARVQAPVGDGFGVFAGDIDAEFGQRIDGLGIQRLTGFGSGGAHPDPPIGELVHQSCGELGFPPFLLQTNKTLGVFMVSIMHLIHPSLSWGCGALMRLMP